MLTLFITIVVRCLLVALFLPFSALDKILNFGEAVEQARQSIGNTILATLLILGGMGIEIIMSLAILTGVADRLAALILAAYCVVTALLWKQFWTHADFRLKGPCASRDIFWDFLKNFALAGGFLLLTFGTSARSVNQFIAQPFASSQPYTQVQP